MGLYEIAESEKVPICFLPLPKTSSMSVLTKTGKCYIGMDTAITPGSAYETVHLAHELGHCITGSFYNRYSLLDVRQKHENRADKWAIQKCISAADLDQAVADGFTDLWSLAEYFNVTEDFMRKAVCYHTFGNVAAELYF